MGKVILWALAALCNFGAAGLTYYDGGRYSIVGLELFAGLLMSIAAVKFTPRR